MIPGGKKIFNSEKLGQSSFIHNFEQVFPSSVYSTNQVSNRRIPCHLFVLISIRDSPIFSRHKMGAINVETLQIKDKESKKEKQSLLLLYCAI